MCGYSCVLLCIRFLKFCDDNIELLMNKNLLMIMKVFDYIRCIPIVANMILLDLSVTMGNYEKECYVFNFSICMQKKKPSIGVPIKRCSENMR